MKIISIVFQMDHVLYTVYMNYFPLLKKNEFCSVNTGSSMLPVLTIVRGTGGDLYVILLFEGRGRGVLCPSFEQKDDTKIAASAGGYIRIARQWRFLVSLMYIKYLYLFLGVLVQ